MREQKNITLSQEAIKIVNEYRGRDVHNILTFSEAVEEILLQHNICKE